MQNGSPFKVRTIDMDNIDEKNEGYCYTIEEVRAKYGPTEGVEYGDDVMICGEKLPKKRAMKFLKQYGKKVGVAFTKLSYEEKYSVMTGSLKFPEEFLRESMSEYWRGSKGKKCDSCRDAPEGT
jgi:NAD(P)H-flavin reductase